MLEHFKAKDTDSCEVKRGSDKARDGERVHKPPKKEVKLELYVLLQRE